RSDPTQPADVTGCSGVKPRLHTASPAAGTRATRDESLTAVPGRMHGIAVWRKCDALPLWGQTLPNPGWATKAAGAGTARPRRARCRPSDVNGKATVGRARDRRRRPGRDPPAGRVQAGALASAAGG